MSNIIFGESVVVQKNLGVSGQVAFAGGITGYTNFSGPVRFSGGVTGPVDFTGLTYLAGGITGTTYVTGDIFPTVSNVYSLGRTGGFGWKDIFVGPGSLHIAGPIGYQGAVATLGSDALGVAYTQTGFATPFINIGNDIGPTGTIPRAVGGWQLGQTGANNSPAFDLIAQQNTPNGLTGPTYSLIKRPGSTGPTGEVGPTGPTGQVGATGPTGTFLNKMLHAHGYTGGGASEGGFTSGSWVTRLINNISINGCFNNISGASLAGNTITLPIGTYFINASAPAHGVDSHAIQFIKTTGSGTASPSTLTGTSEFAAHSGTPSSYGQSRSFAQGMITTSVDTCGFEVQHWSTTTNNSDGLGNTGPIGAVNNIFTQVTITQLN